MISYWQLRYPAPLMSEVTFSGLKNKPGLNLSHVLISCYFFFFWDSASVALYDSQFKIIVSYTGRW